ncbi:MAG: hypothetical protein IJ048_08880 [Clostridia bacterium]|nr:hypothetical protein [Clostridia bacterium]
MTEKMQETPITGRDISRPTDSMELDGQTYPLAFDMAAFRVAEDVYELQYGRNLNFADIVTHLATGKIGAIMAVLYGALLSGGLKITWAEYYDKFRLINIPGVKDKLIENVKKALPETDGKTADPQ